MDILIWLGKLKKKNDNFSHFKINPSYLLSRKEGIWVNLFAKVFYEQRYIRFILEGGATTRVINPALFVTPLHVALSLLLWLLTTTHRSLSRCWVVDGGWLAFPPLHYHPLNDRESFKQQSTTVVGTSTTTTMMMIRSSYCTTHSRVPSTMNE